MNREKLREKHDRKLMQLEEAYFTVHESDLQNDIAQITYEEECQWRFDGLLEDLKVSGYEKLLVGTNGYDTSTHNLAAQPHIEQSNWQLYNVAQRWFPTKYTYNRDWSAVDKVELQVKLPNKFRGVYDLQSNGPHKKV